MKKAVKQGELSKPQLSESIQAWMVIRLAEELHVPRAEIDVRKPFLDYGLDSIVAFTLTGELADWLGFDLPATLFWDHPTLEALAQFLAENIAKVNPAFLSAVDVRSAVEEIERLDEKEAQDALMKKGNKKER